MKRFRRALASWAWGLLGGSIGGALASVASLLTTNGLNATGVDVPKMDFNTFKVVFVVSLLTHAVAYYAKSPAPRLEFDDTTPPIPLPDGSNVKPKDQ